MSNSVEKTPKAVEKKEQVVQCPPSLPQIQCKPIQADERYFIQLGVKVKDDGTVVPDESNVVDLVDLIQSYKDQCGMEAAQRLLKTGEKTPADFADPGIIVDATQFPANIQEAANLAVASGKRLEAMKEKYNIPNKITGEQIEEMLADDSFAPLLSKYFSDHPEIIKPKEVNNNAE